ncbi:nicotinamidase [Methylobacterium sp. Leaf469]|uniref:bifunctional nicotinamidase/pyrazinamidase n=1 Tax=unclassified Methylobacterium TaxID=2615210 RepID=UPI0006F311FC|nr:MULTISPECIES: bifunctional nicotinamidase/pyrazinamidase [unclassified Methylobacterium]KQP68865.1 nicotinamidase [Methylobacterium sp. Leaf112]KQU04913.1 nicotinamidase [Methylobacterium sp. Leaf469]
MIPGSSDILLVVDVQVDFLARGALAVPDGDAVIAPINRLIDRFAHVVVTQDWHPPGHVSFATSHPGRAAFESVVLPYGRQVLWPEHCVRGTAGAALAPGLRAERAELVVRKGHQSDVDSYSAFLEADRTTPTGLAGYLRERGFTRVVVCGLATDYCVGWTALDARAAGFEAVVVTDAVRGIDIEGSVARAMAAMAAAGVGFVESAAYTALP